MKRTKISPCYFLLGISGLLAASEVAADTVKVFNKTDKDLFVGLFYTKGGTVVEDQKLQVFKISPLSTRETNIFYAEVPLPGKKWHHDRYLFFDFDKNKIETFALSGKQRPASKNMDKAPKCAEYFIGKAGNKLECSEGKPSWLTNRWSRKPSRETTLLEKSEQLSKTGKQFLEGAKGLKEQDKKEATERKWWQVWK